MIFFAMNHPHAFLENILTFMWCLWKSRNDNLFCRTPGAPHQIHQAARAIQQNLEMVDLSVVYPLQVQRSDQRQDHMVIHDAMPMQGGTIKSDLLITGPKIFSDAAWKSIKVPGCAASTSTGIGVFCQLPGENVSTNVLVQASVSMTTSPLQAEASALLLAATVAKLLHLQQVTLLTDNSSLAAAAASRRPSSPQVQWEIRQQIAKYIQVTQKLAPSVCHISRDLNKVAHTCARQAIRQSLYMPIFSCTNSTHANSPCPISLALHSLNSQGFVIHAVYCS
jgi:hypothetical protein